MPLIGYRETNSQSGALFRAPKWHLVNFTSCPDSTQHPWLDAAPFFKCPWLVNENPSGQSVARFSVPDRLQLLEEVVFRFLSFPFFVVVVWLFSIFCCQHGISCKVDTLTADGKWGQKKKTTSVWRAETRTFSVCSKPLTRSCSSNTAAFQIVEHAGNVALRGKRRRWWWSPSYRCCSPR